MDSSTKKLSHNPLQPYDSSSHVEIIINLKENFKDRFENSNRMLCWHLFASPFFGTEIQELAACVAEVW
nr:unnamed protein product [Callosobruchus chinensis]